MFFPKILARILIYLSIIYLQLLNKPGDIIIILLIIENVPIGVIRNSIEQYNKFISKIYNIDPVLLTNNTLEIVENGKNNILRLLV